MLAIAFWRNGCTDAPGNTYEEILTVELTVAKEGKQTKRPQVAGQMQTWWQVHAVE